MSSRNRLTKLLYLHLYSYRFFFPGFICRREKEQSKLNKKETEIDGRYLQRQRLAPPAHPACSGQAPLVVVQGVGARRVAAVVVGAGAVAVAVPAAGVEAAEQERRHSRGHRHGSPPLGYK